MPCILVVIVAFPRQCSTCRASSFGFQCKNTLTISFIATCCVASISLQNIKFSFYQPLHVPYLPWDYISMGFHTSLPMTLGKHGAICVVACHFSKISLFLPCAKTTTIGQTTELFFHHVWLNFVLPTRIIFYHDAQFLRIFLKMLWDLLGFQIHYSTTFHP